MAILICCTLIIRGILVGDVTGLHGIAAAKAAGMVALGFAAGSHCGPEHAAQLRAAGADAVAADAAALAGLIAGYRGA